jgi:hypothetical protein
LADVAAAALHMVAAVAEAEAALSQSARFRNQAAVL